MLRKFSDRLLGTRIKRNESQTKFGFFIVGIVIIFLLGNITYLNLKVLQKEDVNTTDPVTQDLDKKTDQKESLIQPESVETTSVNSTGTVRNVSFKDYYINIGTGSNRSTEWTDVGGALSTFDIASYNNVQEARLETNINVPTSNGTVSVRLYNKTDNRPVWNSERTVQAEQQGALLISEKLGYDSGPKLYQIQMKTQLGVEANLVQSRVKIVAE